MAKKSIPTSKTDFFRSIVKDIDDEYTSFASDEQSAAEFTGWVDTGCYLLNGLVSSSIFGGFPNNKAIALAGESATGKTYFALGIAKNFLDANPEGYVLYYDTEAAITNKMMTERGIDTKRVIISEPETLEAFKIHCVKFLNKYAEADPADRLPLMIVLDSLGMLPTAKEVEDTKKEDIKANVGSNAKIIKSIFREIRLKLAKLRVPMIITNHIYTVIGAYVPMKEMSGGSGIRYAADVILFLGKKKDRDGTDVVGNIITVKNDKNRMAKENAKAEVKLSYTKGLDRYYGLLDLGEKYGIFKKTGHRYLLPNGTTAFPKDIYGNPEIYFTDDVLKSLDEAARKEFAYGGGGTSEQDDVEDQDFEEAV